MTISPFSDQPNSLRPFNFTLLPSITTNSDISTFILFPLRPQNPSDSDCNFNTLKSQLRKTPISLDLSLSSNSSDHNASNKTLLTADSDSKTIKNSILDCRKKTPISLDLSLSGDSSVSPSPNNSKKRPRPLILDETRAQKLPARPKNKNRTNGPFWSIKKTLTKSDLGHLSRLIVASEDVQNNIIPYWEKSSTEKLLLSSEGVTTKFWDCDTNTEHEMVFKRWKSNGSHIFNKNWNEQFVKRRGLKEGDEIGLLWDQENSRFIFSLLKRASLKMYHPCYH